MPTPEKPPLEGAAEPLPEIKDPRGAVGAPEGQEPIAADAAVENENSRETREAGEETKELDPSEELPRIEAALKHNQEQIDQVQAALEGDRAKLEAVRQFLGLPPGSEDPVATKRRLDALRAERERLEDEKKENETVEDLNEVLKQLNTLPKAELMIIVKTGKRGDGSDLEDKNGKKVNPDVAKKLGELAEQGITKVTKAIFKTVLAIVKGILLGIFRGAQEATAESGAASGSE